MDPPRKILIQGPSWVGDIVMATPSLAAIRRFHPDAEISLLLKPGREKVLAGSGDFDEIIEDRSPRGFRDFCRMVGQLRRRRFDLAVLFSDSLRAASLIFLAGIPRRLGYRRNLRSPLLTEKLRYTGPRGVKTPEPMPRRYGRLLEALGVPIPHGRPVLRVTGEEEERARRRRQELGIGDDEPLIGLNPGASFGASKIWPPRHFARLADLVHETLGARSLILVGPGEEPIAAAIAAAMETRPILTGDTPIGLDELKPVIRDLKLLVTTDAGPRHYAVAFGVPVVVIMGPTDRRYTDVHLEETEIVQHDLPCSPCHLKVCPIDHRCMRGISPEEVLERIRALDSRQKIFP